MKKSDMIVTKPSVEKSSYRHPDGGKIYEENDFKSFISEGRVSFVGMNESSRINVLRDTGASQSLLVKDALPLNEQSFTGSNVLIQGIKSGVASVLLHVVDLQSSLVSGPVLVGIVTSLPVPGVSLILGIDLAGDRVMANPCVSTKPCLSVVSDETGNELSEVFPACAVTRAMARQMKAEKQGKVLYLVRCICLHRLAVISYQRLVRIGLRRLAVNKLMVMTVSFQPPAHR